MPDPALPCCVCGQTAARLWRVAPDHLRGGDVRFRAVRCLRCGTARLDPRPSADVLARAHGPGAYARAEGDGGDGEVGKRLDAYNRDVAARADAACPPRSDRPRRLLDVGCGDGRFLAAMAARGWRVEGMETDTEAAGLARRRTNAAIHEAALETADLPPAAFDLVSLLHVLEHVPDPRRVLAEARRVMIPADGDRPGGALLLALPNAGSLEATLFGSAWYHLDLPRHLWGFTPHTLVRLVEESGFIVRSLRYFPFLFAPQSVHRCARQVGLRTFAPVRAVGRGRAAGGGAGGGGAERASSAGRTRVFLALLRLSGRLGRTLPGEIMELVAVRAGRKRPGSEEETS